MDKFLRRVFAEPEHKHDEWGNGAIRINHCILKIFDWKIVDKCNIDPTSLGFRRTYGRKLGIACALPLELRGQAEQCSDNSSIFRKSLIIFRHNFLRSLLWSSVSILWRLFVCAYFIASEISAFPLELFNLKPRISPGNFCSELPSRAS